VTLSEAAIARDLALVLSSVCPRCDGPLENVEPVAPRDPAIWLG
jgi:hypothetical protein